MSDYLTNLIARSTGKTPVIEPRLPSLFEPPGAFCEGLVESEMLVSARDVAPQPSIAAPGTGPQSLSIPPAAWEMLELPRHNVAAEPTGRAQPQREPLWQASAGPSNPLSATESPTTRETEIRVPTKITSQAPEIARADAAAPVFARGPSEKQSEPQPLSPVVIVRPRAMPPIPPVEPVTPAAAMLPQRRTEAAPTIRVTIGRIEVRAMMAPAPALPAEKKRAAPPLLSLNEYLRRRARGDRHE
jgi:hypothetical protein